ncbi:MAG: hypothetical protein ABMA25_13820 [Ilumatobacteraceae bacterium]
MTIERTQMKAAERFFAEVIAEYGITEGDVVRIPMTQCELARRRQRAASTVGAYLSAMGPRVLRRSPEIVLANCAVARPAEAIEQRGEGELLAAYRDLALAQARVIELQAAFADPARGLREMPRGSREVSREEEQEVELEPSSHLLLRDEPRADVAEPADGSAGWLDADLDRVLAPLQRAVERAGLQRMNNRLRLVEVLRPYPLARIEAAVAELVRQTNQRDTRVRSPFGLLHRLALNGDLPAAPAAAVAHEPVRPAAPLAAVFNDDIRTAVASLTPIELAGLDEVVDAEYGSKVAMPPAMRHAARLEQYPAWAATRTLRAHHGDTRSTPRARLGDNTSTSRGDHEDTPSTQGVHA